MGLLVALVALAAGCSGTFRTNIANQSPHPVKVELVYTSWYGGTKVLATKRLAPGDAVVIGPVQAPRSSGRLFAQPEGIAAPRASMNIRSGETTAHVIGAMLPSGIPGVDWKLVERNPN